MDVEFLVLFVVLLPKPSLHGNVGLIIDSLHVVALLDFLFQFGNLATRQFLDAILQDTVHGPGIPKTLEPFIRLLPFGKSCLILRLSLKTLGGSRCLSRLQWFVSLPGDKIGHVLPIGKLKADIACGSIVLVSFLLFIIFEILGLDIGQECCGTNGTSQQLSPVGNVGFVVHQLFPHNNWSPIHRGGEWNGLELLEFTQIFPVMERTGSPFKVGMGAVVRRFYIRHDFVIKGHDVVGIGKDRFAFLVFVGLVFGVSQKVI